MDGTILIAGSDYNRRNLKSIFEDGYTILEARNGEQAINYIENLKQHLSLVMVDYAMPKKTGIEVVQYMNEKEYMDTIPVILVAGRTTAKEEDLAFELGVSDFVHRPFHKSAILHRAENIMRIYRGRREFETEVYKRTAELHESAETLQAGKAELEKNNEFLIDIFSSAVEFRSFEAGDHVKNIKSITRILLNEIKTKNPKYNLTDDSIALMVSASALHDLGKIAISDKILLKPDKLTDEEFEEIKNHTIYGCELLDQFKQDDSDFYRYCYEICRYHHERIDGNGYPDKLAGDAIPIWAQVVGFADVFESLVSQRVYKEAYEVNFAIAMIYNGECGAFSDEIIDAFDSTKKDIFKVVNL